jgi:hypothetical protein
MKIKKHDKFCHLTASIFGAEAALIRWAVWEYESVSEPEIIRHFFYIKPSKIKKIINDFVGYGHFSVEGTGKNRHISAIKHCKNGDF